MLKCFSDLIGETVEAYVDDIIVKSKKVDQLVADLEKTFKKLLENGIKLNPEKCVFGVPRGMLLGFVVSEHDIEANPEKITAITRMPRSSQSFHIMPRRTRSPPLPALEENRPVHVDSRSSGGA
jgi:hypothetical protein